MPKKWWYDAIKNTLANLKEGMGFFQRMAEPIEMMRRQLMLQIEYDQPYGHEEFDPQGYYVAPDGLVSTRIGHTPICLGWAYTVEEIEEGGLSWSHHKDWAGARLKITNKSEHIRWVIGGALEHDEGSERTIFWWGDPQRWPQPEGWRPGYYKFAHINHPGQEPNPFVEKSRNTIRDDMTRTINTGVGEYIGWMMKNAGLKQVA